MSANVNARIKRTRAGKPAWMVSSFPSTTGANRPLNKYMNVRTTGDNRNVNPCTNQLSGIGRKRSQFYTTADGANCDDQPGETTELTFGVDLYAIAGHAISASVAYTMGVRNSNNVSVPDQTPIIFKIIDEDFSNERLVDDITISVINSSEGSFITLSFKILQKELGYNDAVDTVNIKQILKARLLEYEAEDGSYKFSDDNFTITADHTDVTSESIEFLCTIGSIIPLQAVNNVESITFSPFYYIIFTGFSVLFTGLEPLVPPLPLSTDLVDNIARLSERHDIFTLVNSIPVFGFDPIQLDLNGVTNETNQVLVSTLNILSKLEAIVYDAAGRFHKNLIPTPPSTPPSTTGGLFTYTYKVPYITGNVEFPIEVILPDTKPPTMSVIFDGISYTANNQTVSHLKQYEINSSEHSEFVLEWNQEAELIAAAEVSSDGTVEVTLDSSPLPDSITYDTAGVYKIKYTATDAAANSVFIEIDVTIIADTTDPIISISFENFSDAIKYGNVPVTIIISASEQLSNFDPTDINNWTISAVDQNNATDVSFTGSVINNTSSGSVVFTPTSDDTYTISIPINKVKDLADNYNDNSSNTITFIYDTTPPELTFTVDGSDVAIISKDSTVTVKVESSEALNAPIGTSDIAVDLGPGATGDWGTTTTSTTSFEAVYQANTNGTFIFSIVSGLKDLAGNEANVTPSGPISYTFDDGSPVLTLKLNGSTNYVISKNSTVIVKLESNEDLSANISSADISVNKSHGAEGSWGATMTTSTTSFEAPYTATSNGIFTFSIVSGLTDVAGNPAIRPPDLSYTWDDTPPILELSYNGVLLTELPFDISTAQTSTNDPNFAFNLIYVASDNIATLTKADVSINGTVNTMVLGTNPLSYSLFDGINTTEISGVVHVVDPFIDSGKNIGLRLQSNGNIDIIATQSFLETHETNGKSIYFAFGSGLHINNSSNITYEQPSNYTNIISGYTWQMQPTLQLFPGGYYSWDAISDSTYSGLLHMSTSWQTIMKSVDLTPGNKINDIFYPGTIGGYAMSLVFKAGTTPKLAGELHNNEAITVMHHTNNGSLQEIYFENNM